MQIPTLMLTLRKCFRSFFLNSHFTFTNVKELRKGAVDVCDDVFPFFYVEARVAFGDFADDYPCIEFVNVSHHRVCVDGLDGCAFESDGTHVMIVAMVDVCMGIRLQSLNQIIKSLIFINIMCNRIAMHFVYNRCLTTNPKFSVEQTEPLDEGVVASEVAEGDVVIRWLKSKQFKRLFG